MLTSSHVRRLAMAAVLLQALVLAFFVAGTHGWIVSGVKPNTTDYVSFYAAGKLADRGRAPLAYDHDAHLRVEEAATAPGIGYQYFFNPPPFLLITGPLAALPYLASFLLFQAMTLPFWLAVGTRVAGGGGVATLCLLAVPSVWWVLGLGQNSFLSAGLMGLGLLLLPTRKILAGVCFGLLCYKPHLGLLIPVALLAAGEWAALAAAAIVVAAAVGLTVALFGVETWTAFLDMARHSVSGAMDSGKVLLAGRVDPTGAAQELGLTVVWARAVWGVCLFGSVVCVAAVWRRGSVELRNAVLVACVVIAAPFALFYDLIMCSLAACWLVRAARRRGFSALEGVVLEGLVLLNALAAAPIVTVTHIPFGALVAPVLVGLALSRWRASRGNVVHGNPF